MKETPSAALAICGRLPLIKPVCPRRVPVGRYAEAKRPPGFRGPAAAGAIAVCANPQLARVRIGSASCRYQTWSLEAGAPAGLPPDAPPGFRGKRLGPSRTRPPQYVHGLIYASRGVLENKLLPFAWPRGRAHRVTNALLTPHRTRPISLGRVRWTGRDAELVLAPPLVFGGEMGDHLILHWSTRGVEYAVSLHSWAPLEEAVATLRAMVRSARQNHG